MTRKTALGPESVAVIAYLRTHGKATAKDLCAQFPEETKGQLLKRLRNLVAYSWLDFGWDKDGAQHWFVQPSARTAVAAAVAEPPAALNLVPPRRINVMEGTYAPRVFAPTRPGAMDFAAVASRGHC
ncbi:hypothetical protein [Simplicispira psychrophila]|uniref:hypothetical protein n=1 Tax=Simplicispira psychrophila TaxID=80882 RepID=UPI00047F6D4E|nr:hypothetical protein [Simplicispira psychrophila]